MQLTYEVSVCTKYQHTYAVKISWWCKRIKYFSCHFYVLVTVHISTCITNSSLEKSKIEEHFLYYIKIHH